MGYKILTVDDDQRIVSLIGNVLRLAGYEVLSANNGRKGLRQFYEAEPDLVILDVMMPELTGWEVCERIRLISKVPIIILTAKNDPDDVIKGLTMGADDFINKPFHPHVLEARVQAVLRRAKETDNLTPREQMEFNHGRLLINTAHRRVFVNGESISLSPREYDLLVFMAKHPGIVLTNNKIFENVWSYVSDAELENVKWYIWRLRKKIEADPSNPELIMTERGIGYRFTAD